MSISQGPPPFGFVRKGPGDIIFPMPAEIQVEGAPSPIPLLAVLSIGRAADNAVVIKDTSASRHHAVILERAPGEFQLTDLGSRNGTTVNGKRLLAPHILANGDTIEIGEVRMHFRHLGEEPAPAPMMSEEPEATVTFHRQARASILVTDIRGFTGISEKLPAGDVAKLLARWFSDAGRLVEELNGTVDRVIGDALLAYWPEVKSDNNDVGEALTAAREMIARAGRYEQTLAEQHHDLPFRIGCGIHRGTVAMGNIGRHAARDFTIIGDAVNTAFRIEGLCKTLGRQILVSEPIRNAAAGDFRFEDVGTHEIRGKAGALRLFAMHLPGETDLSPCDTPAT